MKALLRFGFTFGLTLGVIFDLASCASPKLQSEAPVVRGPSSETIPADTLSLASTLQPYMKKIGEPIFTYHYVSRETMGVATSGILNLDDPKLATHVQDWSNNFWDLSQPGGTGMVRGFYLATDPVVGRDFGKNHWLIYRVVLKAGLTYLDMKSLGSSSETIPPSIQDQLRTKGCAEQKWSSLMYKSFDPACRAIALKTLQDLDVALVDYAWMSADFPPCTHRPNDAFIVLKPDRLESDAVMIFYAEMPHDDITVMKRQLIMNKLFAVAKPGADQSNSTAAENNPDKYMLWPDMDSSSVTETDLELYLRGHLFGCESLFAKLSEQQ
jgi:hypothetical protein